MKREKTKIQRGWIKISPEEPQKTNEMKEKEEKKGGNIMKGDKLIKRKTKREKAGDKFPTKKTVHGNCDSIIQILKPISWLD